MGSATGQGTGGVDAQTAPRQDSSVNYFEYFSEIEERFVARRGSVLLLSTLDWALIETWREAGVPLAAVLRGIDVAFDKYEARKARTKGRLAKVNGLGWCAQAVMEAARELAAASVGAHTAPEAAHAGVPGAAQGAAPGTAHRPEQQAGGRETGFEAARVARFLDRNAAALENASITGADLKLEAFAEAAVRLRAFAAEVRAAAPPALDELDRRLTVVEERLLAALIAGVPEAELLALREAADRELAPLRARMGAVQVRQVREQFVHKRLFEHYRLPRLSLFYMPLDGGAGEAAP